MKRLFWIALFGVLFAPAVARAQSDEVVYYHTDAIGSVRMVTNASGVSLGRYDYTPFGQQWDFPTSPAPDVRQFAGKEHDETGLDYFGARYYDSYNGRFTSVDPVTVAKAALADPQLWNRYTYVRNNPLRFTDPDGRCIWDLCIGEAAIALGVSEATVVATATTAAFVWSKREQIGRSVSAMTFAAGRALREATDAIVTASRTDPYSYPDNYPQLDRSGKVHTPPGVSLPDHVPESWTREMLEDAAGALRKSLKTRNEEAQRLGEDPAHRKRISEEERLLRKVEKALKEYF